jgi:hypothetical protein
MARLILDTNDYTVKTLLVKIEQQYGKKKNGALFSNADIHDWANKKRIPKQYGGQYIKISKIGPLKVLTLSDKPFDDYIVSEILITHE